MQFFEPMKLPTVTSQSKITPKHGTRPIDSPALRDARATYEAHFAKHLELIDKPLEGALRLTIKFCYALKGKHESGEPYTNKPDWDNAAKLLQDCLMRVGFFKDDSQIVEGHVYQAWSEIPGVYVELEEVEVGR